MVLVVTFYVVVSRCDLVLSVCRKLLDLLIPPPITRHLKNKIKQSQDQRGFDAQSLKDQSSTSFNIKQHAALQTPLSHWFRFQPVSN